MNNPAQKINPSKDAIDGLTTMHVSVIEPFDILERELGPKVKEYRQLWDMAGRGDVKLKYPIHMNVELLYGCNLRCGFCLLNLPKNKMAYRAKPGDRIRFSKYRELVDEGVKEGLCSIALNGFNEPLLKNDIVDYVKYARDAGIIDVSLHTNGLMLDEKKSRELVQSGLTMIMFSIDAASRDTYKKIRRNNNYESVVNNIESFKSIRNALNKVLPLIKVSFVRTKVNCDELEIFLNTWRGNADFITIQSFSNPFVGMSQYNKIEEEYRLDSKPFSFCTEPLRRITITSDGNVLPCCSWYGTELVVGNIYNDSIYNIWNSPKMEMLRGSVNDPFGCTVEPCNKCRASVISYKNNKMKGQIL